MDHLLRSVENLVLQRSKVDPSDQTRSLTVDEEVQQRLEPCHTIPCMSTIHNNTFIRVALRPQILNIHMFPHILVNLQTLKEMSPRRLPEVINPCREMARKGNTSVKNVDNISLDFITSKVIY